MRYNFSNLHPFVQFICLAAAAGPAMACLHPLLLFPFLFGGILLLLLLKGRQSGGIMGVIALPLVASVVINGLFNHRGMHVLCTLPWGAALTAESLLYGAAVGVLFAAACVWVQCLGAVFTADRVAQLFSALGPGITQAMMLIFRLFPLYQSTYHKIQLSTPDKKTSTPLQAAHRLNILSTWAMENGVQTAESMQARGYGVSRRTLCFPTQFTVKDGAIMAAVLLLTAGIAVPMATGNLRAVYDPHLVFVAGGVWGKLAIVFYWVICLLPAILQIRGIVKWKFCR